MSRTRTLLFAGLAALATAGLTACGSLDGSAHVAAESGAAPSSATATPTPAPAAPAVEPAPAPAGTVNASGGGVRSGGGTNTGGAPVAGGGTTNGGTTTGGSNTGGSNTGGSTTGGGTPAAKITSFTVVQQPTCPVHGTPGAPFSSPGTDVKIAWTVTGAKGAALAVDDPGRYGAYGSDYPAGGSLSLPFGCDATGTTSHTFTVWPAGSPGVSRSLTVSARSDG